MSTVPFPTSQLNSSDNIRKPVTLSDLHEMRNQSKPIVMVTAYDYPSAKVVEAAGVDIVLVGDSAAMTVLVYPTTTPVSLDAMIMISISVRRGLNSPLLIGALPFGTYEASNTEAIHTAQRFVKEAGCDAVKLEGGGQSLARAQAIIDTGIPVMGHIGLTPQTATALGGFRAQGRTADRAGELLYQALAAQAAGCFAVVFEAIPAAVCELLMEHMEIPVIGIGAGPSTDGQVLVYHDLLDMLPGHTPKFVEQFAHLHAEMVKGVSAYAASVRASEFPGAAHAYSIPKDELERLQAKFTQTGLPRKQKLASV